MLFYTIFCYIAYLMLARYIYLQHPDFYDDGTYITTAGIFAPVSLPLGILAWSIIKATDWLYYKLTKKQS